MISENARFDEKTQSLNFYAQAYENSPSLLRTVDLNGIVIECNKQYCHTLGYLKEEIIGKSIFEHIADCSLKTMSDVFVKWKKTGMVGDIKLFLKRKNGNVIPVLLSASNIYDVDGVRIGSNTVIRDITNVIKQEKQSEEKQRTINEQYSTLVKLAIQKDSFLAMIAHELKTPLVPIKSYADLLLQKSFGSLNAKQQQFVLQIIKNEKDLEVLISDLLDTQKIELNELKLTQNYVQLENIIDESIDIFHEKIHEKNIQITKSFVSSMMCYCDEYRIKQVLNNLISNAIDFCPKIGGKIDISLIPRGKNAHIVVTDNGIGIKNESLNKIFNKFYQIDSKINRIHGGTGLGLAISKGIILEHKGKIFARSKGENHGASIHIVLPLHPNGVKNV